MDKGLPSTSRSDAVRERVRDVARRVGAGAKLPGAQQFCRDLQISPNTLSKALAELENEGWIERRNGIGVFVAPNAPCQRKIALVCDADRFHAQQSPFWDQVLSRLREESQASGELEMHLVTSSDGAQLPPTLRDEVQNHRVGGVLGVCLNDFAAMEIMGAPVPLVNLFGKGHAIVQIDGAGEMRFCVRELHARGCRKIGLWLPVSARASAQGTRFLQVELQRLFQNALAPFDLPFDAALLQNGDAYLAGDIPLQVTEAQQGFETAKRVFSAPRENWPDGVIITNDLMAHGALVGLRQRGLRLGEDVEVAARVNTLSPLFVGEPHLFGVEVSPADLAQTMWAQLKKLQKLPPEELREDQIFNVPVRPRWGDSHS